MSFIGYEILMIHMTPFSLILKDFCLNLGQSEAIANTLFMRTNFEKNEFL